MHNMHVIRLYAEATNEALLKALDYASEWSDSPDNYTEICSVLGKDGSIYETGAGRFGGNTIPTLSRDLFILVVQPPDREVEDKFRKDPTSLFSFEYWNLKQQIGWRENCSHLMGMNVWRDVLYPEELDEVGITDISEYGEKSANFLVVIDMHS